MCYFGILMHNVYVHICIYKDLDMCGIIYKQAASGQKTFNTSH